MATPLLLLLSLLHTPLWLLALLVGGSIILYTPYKRLLAVIRPLSFWQKCQAVGWVPVIRVTGDLAKMIGYPVGWWWRGRHSQQLPAHYPH